MELLQLKYFCDSAETENFSTTAKKYLVPPSNISQSIGRLEKELGLKLFDRTANKISLNSNGKLIYSHMKAALTHIEDAEKIASEENENMHGEIKILLCCNRIVVTEAIKKYKQIYPDVSFILDHNVSVIGNYDFIISDEIENAEKYDKTLLLNEKILLAVLDTNGKYKNNNFDIKSLKNERFITMQNGSSLYRITKNICASAGFEPNIAIKSDDPDCTRRYIEMGLGVSFVPAVSWKNSFSDSISLIDIGNFQRETYVFWRKEKYMSRAAHGFLKILTETH